MQGSLFAGGPLHGQEIEVALDPATGGLPPVYVDLQSAHGYNLTPWRHNLGDGAGNVTAMYFLPIYLSADAIGATIQSVHQVILKAIIKWFCLTQAIEMDDETQPPPGPDPRNNGHIGPVTWYSVRCETEAVPLDGSPFTTLKERAEAMRRHLEANPGHSLRWTDELIPSVTNDVSTGDTEKG